MLGAVDVASWQHAAAGEEARGDSVHAEAWVHAGQGVAAAVHAGPRGAAMTCTLAAPGTPLRCRDGEVIDKVRLFSVCVCP